ncbi:MAG: DUF1045 domain-containing protein [Pseudomonadota bacterium]
MNEYTRYAVFYAPAADTALARLSAAWLGWDAQNAVATAQPRFYGVDMAQVTATPRKYGFHGTLKPPFRLAQGTTVEGLSNALQAFCAATAPVVLDGLEVRGLGRFLALLPTGDTTGLAALSAELVRTFDRFRAPLNDREVARRRPERLTDRQRTNPDLWGYPFVFEDFRFHLTLSGPRDGADMVTLQRAAQDHFAAAIEGPFLVDALTLFGERPDGMFKVLHRYDMTGSSRDSTISTV